MMPTRSAAARARPRAVQRVRSSSLIARSATDGGTGHRVHPAAWPVGSDRRDAPPGPVRSAAPDGRRVRTTGGAHGRIRAASMATDGCRVTERSSASESRSGVKATVSIDPLTGAPAIRRSSPARIGPTNGTSASPRPSSSAMRPTSTPEVSGWPPSSASRNSRQPDDGTAASSFAVRSAVADLADGMRSELIDHPGGGVAQGLLLGREADVHQAAGPEPAWAAIHSSRRTRRSTLPEGSRGMAPTTTTSCSRLYGGQRFGHQPLELAVAPAARPDRTARRPPAPRRPARRGRRTRRNRARPGARAGRPPSRPAPPGSR